MTYGTTKVNEVLAQISGHDQTIGDLTVDDVGADSLTTDLLVVATQTPATAGAAGVKGTIAWDGDFLYICSATDTWLKVAIATWS